MVGIRDPKPAWLKVKAPSGERYAELKQTFRRLDLNTVCEEARCPNVGECWGTGTATLMILGHTCTRGCRFCAVTTGNPRGAVDPREPEHVGRALSSIGLRYVVLTMVDRDDLLDGGAAHVAETIRALRRHQPELLVEALVGDFSGRKRDVDVVLDAAPDVFAHNIEVVRRLTPTIRDQRCDYDLSLDVLRHAKARAPSRFVKSSLMVGIGERDDEVEQTLADLRAAGVDVVTLGQYLRPTEKHAAVARYVEPERFAAWAEMGRALGFAHVAAGPLVRSSYHAAEAFLLAQLRPEGSPEMTAKAPDPPSPGAFVPAGRLARRPADG
ncbi:MAG: lipoyl synthase [Myxococcales bacterium]|nr:lipoyl synthase [Myxococcales bacterium]